MPSISDAPDLLIAQHEHIDSLLELVATLHDPDALAELADAIASHLGVEQTLLYSHRDLQLAPHIHDELMAEHHEIKLVLSDLIWRGVDDDDFAPALANLRLLVDGHMAYQEDELFTRAAMTMSRSELAGLGCEIAKRMAPSALHCALARAS